MHNKLLHEEFVDLAPDEVGSIRVNHESPDCSGQSKSLKIERKEDGTISAHCFRCGQSGWFSPDFYRAKEALRNNRQAGNKSSKPSSRFTYPSDATGSTSEWPAYARNWIRQYGLSNNEITENGISYSPYFDRLYFDVFDTNGKSGFASRRLSEYDEKPKWLYFADGGIWQGVSPNDQKTDSTLVLVEDIVSAIKIRRLEDALALLKTTINVDTMTKLFAYKHFIIWLDNDNRQVKLNQLKLANRLSTLGTTRVVHSTDPKNLSMNEIREILYE